MLFDMIWYLMIKIHYMIILKIILKISNTPHYIRPFKVEGLDRDIFFAALKFEAKFLCRAFNSKVR